MSEINCPSCLEDLNRPAVCEKSTGGMVTEFLYAKKDDVQTWPVKQAASLRTQLAEHIETIPGSNLVMKPGKRMFKMQIKKSSAELKYAMQGESGSRSFKTTLECFSPVVRSIILGFLAATANQELVIIAKTRTGDWHLLGDEDEGVEYDSSESATGKAGSDPNGTTITFTTECAAPTIYKGDTSSLAVVNGSAPTITLGAESVSGTTATLDATVTDADGVVTEAGFRYSVEGSGTWTTKKYTGAITSGTPFTVNVNSLTPGDYIFYGYIKVDGQEVYTATKVFTIV